MVSEFFEKSGMVFFTTPRGGGELLWAMPEREHSFFWEIVPKCTIVKFFSTLNVQFLHSIWKFSPQSSLLRSWQIKYQPMVASTLSQFQSIPHLEATGWNIIIVAECRYIFHNRKNFKMCHFDQISNLCKKPLWWIDPLGFMHAHQLGKNF